MALARRDRGMLWPDRERFDWRLNPLESFRRMIEEEVKVEEFTEDRQLVVRAELPGVDPDKDVDISIVDGNLCIRAERRHEEKIEERDYRRAEIRYGSFVRVLPLPAKTKEDDIKATYKDGILEVRAPINEGEGRTSKVPISRS
jgi:HSP20 family protein